MPRMKLQLPEPTTPWTKIPNHLLDNLMPRLKDTELRVLLVLLRQTVGWQKSGRPIVIPYRSLKKRTGRQSEAIAGALRSLRDRELIHMRFSQTQRADGNAKSDDSRFEQQQ